MVADAFHTSNSYKPKSRDVAAFLDSVQKPGAVDDRKGAFSTGLGILSHPDLSSDIAKVMNDNAVNMLFDTVSHPPVTYLGATSFRRADGGGNNLENPDLGRAGTVYARSVPAKAGRPRTSLPDAGLVFDTILKRQTVEGHAEGMSSLFFAFASIVTYSLFRTDPKDVTVNQASSYFDLSPLYGDNQISQDKIRDKAAGRGLLYPDTFSEDRLLLMPAAASALLIVFSRNHNYIAEHLLKINERQIWSDPPPLDQPQRIIQDEQIFQTAKLINCGSFMSAVLGDYVAGFLGLSEGRNWNVNAYDPIDTNNLHVGRGLGNHVSVEFNVLHRWHSAIYEQDKWTNGVFKNGPVDGPSEPEMYDTLTPTRANGITSSDPARRTFAGLRRGSDGKFSDDDLAQILHAATEKPAGAFRQESTPPDLRFAETFGIQQSRAWGVCTMNEFRKFLGLKQFETFEQWNPDPRIAGAARRLYGHVDNLELYTGLQAEASIPLSDGCRFPCGYTTARGLLGHAIALIRGDRFYTTDFSRGTLTAWGFYDCQRDMNNGAFGGHIPKLLLRHLPRHFPFNSVYSLFPLFQPSYMKESLTRQGTADKYTFSPPVPLPLPKILNTFTGIKTVFSDPAHFKVVYKKQGYGSVMVFDEDPAHNKDRTMLVHAVFPTVESLKLHAGWMAGSVKAKIQERTWTYPDVEGKYVDIVKDVINVVACHVAADKLAGVPVKTKDNPKGLFSEEELFDMLTTLFTVTFLTFDDPENGFSLNEAATQASNAIGALTAKAIMAISSSSSSPSVLGNLKTRVSSLLWSSPEKHDPWYPFLSDIAKTGRPLEELLGNIIGLAVGASVNYAHATVNVIDFYLDDARAKEREHIIKLVKGEDADSAELLRGYVCEAMRLKPQFNGLWRQATADAVINQGPGLPPLEIKAGDRIWGSFRNAHLNPEEFPNPTAVDLHRPYSSYNLNGAGFHNCPGTDYSILTIIEVVKIVFLLKNVRRAPGDAGRLNGYTEVIRETETDFFVQRDGRTARWPGSMYLVYDE